MLTTVDYSGAAGINNVEWDAVELPSQFMENWCYDRTTLFSMGRHYETGEVLPEHDYQKLLALREVDAVLIATPDHWHAAMSIDAGNAGKDVYVEKPLTYTIDEGKAIIRAARLNDRVFQVGMQQRSGAHYAKAKAEYFDSGKLGKITLARTWWHGNGYHLRKAPFKDKPAGLDWKKFQGPRPWRDWDVQQFWNWRAYLDFGGGQITDLFTHWIDVVHWFMNEDLPKAAVASGGVYQYKDGRTAPDTIHVLLEYPGEWTATFEATLAPGIRGAGIEFVGTQGRLEITRGGYTFNQYQAFKTANTARPGVVYVGANDGMVHAFDAATGNEVFAYIPSMVVPSLKALSIDPYTHTLWGMRAARATRAPAVPVNTGSCDCTRSNASVFASRCASASIRAQECAALRPPVAWAWKFGARRRGVSSACARSECTITW